MAVIRFYNRRFGCVDTHIHIISIAPVAETVHRIKRVSAVDRRFGKYDARNGTCHERRSIRRFVIQRYAAEIVRSGNGKPVFQRFAETADRTRKRRLGAVLGNRVGLRSIPRVIYRVERIRAVCRQLRAARILGIT